MTAIPGFEWNGLSITMSVHKDQNKTNGEASRMHPCQQWKSGLLIVGPWESSVAREERGKGVCKRVQTVHSEEGGP